MFKLDLEKAKEPEIKLPTSVQSSKQARKFHKNIYFCFIDYAKAFGCVDHNKLWKILKDMGIMRESFPRQIDKKSRGLQGERGLEFSRRKKRQTLFFFFLYTP